MDSIAHLFKGENDFLNQEGFEIGFKDAYEKERKKIRREVQTGFVKNLLAAKNITISDIAKFVGVTEAFVKKIKNSL